MDWAFVNRNWEKWACNSIGPSGQPLKAALLLNYDPTGPSRLLSTIGDSLIRNFYLVTKNHLEINFGVFSAEEEGTEADPIEVGEFVNFVKRGNYQNESFFIESNQCEFLKEIIKKLKSDLHIKFTNEFCMLKDVVTSIHENWFCGRCLNTSKPAGEGAIVYKTPSFLFIAIYDGSIGAASRAMAAVDRFVWQLERRNL